MRDFKSAIRHAVDGNDFSSEEIQEIFEEIMSGNGTPAQIGGLLIALRMKGVSAEEIAGAAKCMRSHALAIECPDRENAVDTCGTGGDGSGSVNVSTMSAIVTAAAGGLVAKHGNRALSSRSGSADVLEALGVGIAAPVLVVEKCMSEIGIGFLFAPSFHPATKHAAGPRKELGTRTIFNLLGPLTNPARPRNQVIGVFAASWCLPLAEALGQLGARRIYVVHGNGGMDEIAVSGSTTMAYFDESSGKVQELMISPGDFGLAEEDPAGLQGGDPASNAQFARDLFGGSSGAGRAAVVMESAVALRACGIAEDFREGAERAIAAIDSGKATQVLADLVAMTGEYAS